MKKHPLQTFFLSLIFLMLPVMADYLGLLPFPGIGRMIGIILGVILGVVALALSASLLFSALSAPSFTQK